jgi:hypothetical protein
VPRKKIVSLNYDFSLTGARDKFCYKRFQREIQEILLFEILTLQWRMGMKEPGFPKTIPLILLHALRLTGYKSMKPGEVGRTKAEATPNGKGMLVDMPDG